MNGHHGLYRTVGRIEGEFDQFRAETRADLATMGQQMHEMRGGLIHHTHLHREAQERLTALETAKAAPQAVSLRAVAAEVLAAIAPAGGWSPWLLMALLALMGIIKPEEVRAYLHDFALGSRPAASAAPAPG